MIRSVEPLITVEDYAKRWLDLIQVVVKPGTYRRYEQLLKRHIIPSLGALPVRHVHKGVIKDFLTHKLSREVKIQNPFLKPTNQREKRLARNSVRNLHAILRAMLRAATDDGLIVVNPAEKLGRRLRLVTSKTARQEG
jgi:integrase